jgi:hypothetical protein
MLIKSGNFTCDDIWQGKLGSDLSNGAYTPRDRAFYGSTFFISLNATGGFYDIAQTFLNPVKQVLILSSQTPNAFYYEPNPNVAGSGTALARVFIVRDSNGTFIRYGGYVIKYCQCLDDEFKIDCTGVPNNYCCIKKKVVEDACRKLKG